VAEAGFEVALDPLAVGKCFYHAASTLTPFIFDHLKNHQFDVSNRFFMDIFRRFHSESAWRCKKIALDIQQFETIALMPCFSMNMNLFLEECGVFY